MPEESASAKHQEAEYHFTQHGEHLLGRHEGNNGEHHSEHGWKEPWKGQWQRADKLEDTARGKAGPPS